MSLHAFVAMPFGTKENIDFNAVYNDLIKPALEQEGFEVFRADEETRADTIQADMLQELILADLVVVDLSIDHPKVWYELGVRHALRKRGVIQIQSSRLDLPFDVSMDRTLRYAITEGMTEQPAIPDPAKLENDRASLRQFVRNTMGSWHGRVASPVYVHLRDLPEPNWHELRSDQALEFWARYRQWSERIEMARRRGCPEDIIVLADEAPTRMFRLDALKSAGKALRSLGSHTFALSQFEEALQIAPDDLESGQQKGILLGRMGRYPEARECLERVMAACPKDAETLSLLGRLEKEAWIATWNKPHMTQEERQREAEYEDARLIEAARAYGRAFQLDPSHYYSGINAVTLRHLLIHLTDRDILDAPQLEVIEGAVQWAIESALAADARDYWARVSLADFQLLKQDVEMVERAYRDAAAVSEDDWFALDASFQQLRLLQDFGFRPPQVEAGLRALQRSLDSLETPQGGPNKVFLLSGHMIDAPGREEPRFPPCKETIARQAIAVKLDELGAGEGDVGLCGGACGSDLLFAEACLERGLRVELRIPFGIPTFLQKSVRFPENGEVWQARFHDVWLHNLTTLKAMPEELGPTAPNVDPYARHSLWQLYAALAYGSEKVRFIAF